VGVFRAGANRPTQLLSPPAPPFDLLTAISKALTSYGGGPRPVIPLETPCQVLRYKNASGGVSRDFPLLSPDPNFFY